ncbi:uncharacterized protein LOC119383680 isoform X2 [Rhipicephalus sanguineus]|uniref:uncharacterized protein LOC119383680 isoform X2 n=1 Tax=Rhipicephalus sanguineus TaxID=34632 RepID=UPI0018952074|nr:uncharacterized protein LOC119383680 isoform X2 [Rhipicephalus sanguineus]
MRNAALLLMLVIFAPIDEVSSFAFGAFLARLMVRLPQLLRPALRIDRKAEELELPDVYGIAMAPPPGPHDLLHNPNDDITGYTGPGIAGVPEFSANSSTLITCGKCHCTFPWQAKFYGDKVGCTSDVKKFSCTCTHKSCNTGKLVKCLNNLAKGKCVSYRYHIDCLVSNKNTG